VRTVTRLSAGRPRNRSVPSRGNRFFFFSSDQTISGNHSVYNGYRRLLCRE